MNEGITFEFATAGRIIFGEGTISQVGAIAAEIGKNIFVIIGKNTERARPLLNQLDSIGIKYIIFNVESEPTTITAKAAVQKGREGNCDAVIAFGGGSVIDTAKVVSAMLTNAGQLEDYLEVVGKGKPITNNCKPCIAIPTTAGTGTEVTRNSVLNVPEHKVKVSMRSPLMIPDVAVVDPLLTHSMPPSITASTGLDALTQLMEAYVSNKANPLTDGICREGIKRAGRSLQKAYEDGGNRRAREDMSIASLFGGLALANAKLGAVHGFAGPMGGMFNAPHGVICANLLPHVMKVNVEALQKRASDSQALLRYDEIAQYLTGNSRAKADDGVRWIQQLCSDLEVTPLSDFGLKEEDFEKVAAKAQNASSMKGNPIVLTEEELLEILKKQIKN